MSTGVREGERPVAVIVGVALWTICIVLKGLGDLPFWQLIATTVVVPDKISGVVELKVTVSIPHSVPLSEHVGVAILCAVDKV